MTAPVRVCALDGCDQLVLRRDAQFCSRACSHIGRRKSGRSRSQWCRGVPAHELTDANTYVDGRGGRRCKACVARRETGRVRADRPNTHLCRRLPAVSPPAVVVPPAPPVVRGVWRPAGWAPLPPIPASTEREVVAS